MTKSRMKMCDGSEYTVFYLNNEQVASPIALKVNDLKPNKAGYVFEPLNKKSLTILYKLFGEADYNKN